MSRLDSMIRRLQAQRDGINWAVDVIDAERVAGDVVEIGLGNGRTYDHLREKAGERSIWVIERAPNPHPSCMPPADCLLEMEAEDGFAALQANGVRAALAHYDLGVGVAEVDRPLAEACSPGIAALLAPGGIAIANNPLIGLEQIPGPPSIKPGRYFFYRR